MDERQFLEEQCLMFAAAALVNMKHNRTDARPIGSKMPEKPESKMSKPTAQRRILVSGKKRGRKEDTHSLKKRAKLPILRDEPMPPMLTLDMTACAAVSPEDDIPKDYVFTPDIDVGRVGVKKAGISAWGAAADGEGYSLTAEEQLSYFG